LPSDDPVRRRPDIDHAKRTLYWKPKTNLNEGLIKTIEHFKEYLTGNHSMIHINSPQSELEIKTLSHFLEHEQ
jgi:UDP-glucuronate decarboxylase